MKLLFDQNLSPDLVRLLTDLYPGSMHVRDVGMERADDQVVWNYAIRTQESSMSLLIAVFGLFISTVGVLGMVQPERLISLARAWQTPTGLYVGAGLRIVLGLILFLAAPNSRAPDTLRIFGVVILIVGLATPFVGVKRSHRLLEWWAARGPAFQRAWAGCTLVLGLLLIYAAFP